MLVGLKQVGVQRGFVVIRGMFSAFQRASGALFARFFALLSTVFGELSWAPPAWASRLASKGAPVLRWGASHRGLIMLVLALCAAVWWAQPMIKKALHGVLPDQIEARHAQVTVTAPARTEIENEGAPHPIVVEFSVPAAPLARVGKEAIDVTLSPSHPGKWVWTTETRLEFIPKEDWPVGTKYEIRLGKKALAPLVDIDERVLEVQSPPFEMTVSRAEFYQDPVQSSLRKAVFEVHFSHPVQPVEFEKRVRLSYDDGEKSLLDFSDSNVKFSVVYDKYKITATVQSEPLPIPVETTAMVMQIASGVTAQRGGPPTSAEIVKAIDVPGINSLAIEAIDATIITGDDGEPEHVLHVQSSMAVHEREMARMVSAWALPARNVAKGAPDDAGWNDPAEVTASVLKRAIKVPLTLIAQERETGESHSFRFKAEPGTFLLIRVEKGLKAVGGYQLGTGLDSLIQVKAFAPELTIMSQGSLLALSGDKKLPILVRDLPGIRVEIARLLPHQLHMLATQSEGAFTRPEFYQGISPDHLTERFEREIPLKLRPGKTHYETIDFAEYLKAGSSERRGVFLLSVRGYDAKRGKQESDESDWGSRRQDYEGDYAYEGEGEQSAEAQFDPSTLRDSRLVIVTDLGLLIKKSVDGTQDVFIQSITNGLPVKDAVVEVLGRNGLVLTTQKTDASGHARLPNLQGFKREKLPVLLVAKKAGDLSFMPLGRNDRGLDLSRFDVGGAYSAGLPNQTRAYLFSDRGMYRPGDTMHIGVIVKSGDWAQATKGLPVEAEVIDARGLVAKREKLIIGPGGMAEVSYTTFDSSPTGNYTINLNLARETGQPTAGAGETAPLRLGSTSVKVQEFLPDRMKISARLSSEVAEGWVHPAALKAMINVQNLFGTPAPKRRVQATLTLTPAYPAFRSYPDYAFFDPQRNKQRYSEPLAEGETDASGNLELDLGLQRYESATYQLHLLAKAFEPEGGRSVAAEATTLVSEMPYLVGFKADGDLGYISRATTRQVSLVVINPAARKIAVKGLKLQQLERKVVSVLVKQRNGLYKYESRSKEVMLKESALAIPAQGQKFALATNTPGNFVYVIRNADGLELNRIEYSVAGTGNVSRSLDRNAELQLSLNKKDYNPGDEIEVSIRAPYSGAGLITIERDRVYAHQWFKADHTASVQKIRLPRNFEGNGYVTVQFVRDPASDEVYMSPLSYGVVPFATNLAARTTHVALHAPDRVKPGQVVKMRLESAQPARAVVFAVDEGILQVARYQSPDPLKFFFEKRALEVGTSQTLDLILPEFKKLMHAAAPGGDAEGGLGKHLNPFKRKTDKPVVYWSGVVDVNGSKEFSYTVPDNYNGTLRIMAVVVNDHTTAAATTNTLVRGDLILLPTVPVALTPGDEVEIGVGLANNLKGSGKKAPIALTLQTSSHLEVVGASQQTLNVSENGEASTKFRIRARAGIQAKLGSASVIISAHYKDAAAKLSTDLSVRPASPFVTLVQTGRFQGAGELRSQANLYPNFQRNEFAVSSSPWSFTSGLLQYLGAYPHGCTEQITSQTFPLVILSSMPVLAKELLATKNVTGDSQAVPNPRKALERTVSTLRSRQTSEGGFGLWDAGYVEPFASVYATHMLLEARERKLPVPEDMYQRSMMYLQTYLSRSDSNRYDWRNRAYAAYLLTRQGVVTTASLVNLRASLPKESGGRKSVDLGVAYLAASYQMLKQEKVAQELLAPVWNDLVERIRTNKRYSYWDHYYDPLVHDSMLIYLVAKHFPTRFKQLPGEAFERIGAQVQDGWYHSLSSASVILAVDAYSAVVAQAAAGVTSVSAVDRQGKTRALALGPLAPLAKVAVPLNTARLRLTNRGDFPLYYALSEAGYERDVPAAARISGLEIIREFLNNMGQPITEATLGEEVTVRIRVRSIDKHDVADVAVADVLPGGLEPVLTSPSDSDDTDQPLWRRRLGGSGSWNIQYADIREDRVLFYGNVNRSQTEISYKVRATNVGNFVVPAVWGEAMYDRKTFARSAGGKFAIKPLAK